MKKIALVFVLGFVLAASHAYADEATTTAAYPGGHLTPVVVGNSDSIHNKGAWVLENIPGQISGKISYIAEASGSELTRLQSLFSQFIAKFSDHFAK